MPVGLSVSWKQYLSLYTSAGWKNQVATGVQVQVQAGERPMERLSEEFGQQYVTLMGS